MSGVDNPPAFPSVETHPSFDIPMHHFGMTLRDWFAGQALGRLVGNDDTVARASWTANPEENLAAWSYRIADAMLAERSKAIAAATGEGL